jgi:hypothetical protein
VPVDDLRLEAALRDAAPTVGTVDTADVVARVGRRRVRRRRNRRLTTGALALVALLAVGTVTVLVTREDGSSPHVATPATQEGAERIITGDGPVSTTRGEPAALRAVPLDRDVGLLSPPLVAGRADLSVASYDRGPAGSAASHIVQIRGDHVDDVVTLKAHVLSMADGEGARWAVTQNLVPTGGTVPDAFLKRIGADDQPVSKPLAVDAEPVGPVVVGVGMVWVPVRDGVLQYSTDLRLLRTLPLPAAQHRAVAVVGTDVVVTDGDTLQVVQFKAGTVTPGLAFSTPVLDLEPGTGRWLVDDGTTAAVGDLGSSTPRIVLPTGFRAKRFASSPSGSAVAGTVDGKPAIVLLGATGVRATVVLPESAPDTALARTGARTVSVVTADALFEVAVP